MVEKALFLPHNPRHAYFHGFLKYAQENRGWRFGVVCTEDSRKAFRDAIGPGGRFFFVPDFGAQSPWEKDPNESAREGDFQSQWICKHHCPVRYPIIESKAFMLNSS